MIIKKTNDDCSTTAIIWNEYVNHTKRTQLGSIKLFNCSICKISDRPLSFVYLNPSIFPSSVLEKRTIPSTLVVFSLSPSF